MGGMHGQPMVLTVVGLLAVALTPVQCDFRTSLLDKAHERIDVWYQDKNNLEPAMVKDGVSYQLSKEDKQCDDAGVPVTFLEFTIDGIRPVDAFNAIAASDQQPRWDPGCDEMIHLADLHDKRARGMAGIFSAKGLLKLSREFYEFQMTDANFTTEEFWVVFTTLDNQELRQMKSPQSGAVQAQNCLAAYRISSTPEGVHVVVSQQINPHPWPLAAREAAKLAFSTLYEWAQAFSGAAQEQAKLGWNATQTVVPDWMLYDAPCTAEAPNLELQRSLFAKAQTVLQDADRGARWPEATLPNGEELKSWQKWELCDSGNTPNSPFWWLWQLPIFQLEFRIPSAEPDDVFNVLANKVQEPRWNSNVKRVSVTDFSGSGHAGVRGVHEEVTVPDAPSWLAAPREFWEWQAINHSFEDKTYLIALASTTDNMSAYFQSGNVEGAQCLAAYEVSPDKKGGTHVRMVTHPNPHVSPVLKPFVFVWNKVSWKMLRQYVIDLTEEAQRVARVRGSSGKAISDGSVLSLLSPAIPGRNQSVSVAEVLEAKEDELLDQFAQLDLPYVLNTSTWEDFNGSAAQLRSLGRALKANMTHAERDTFRGKAAADEIDVQMQGEVLSAVQKHVIEQFAVDACSDDGPDIDNDKPEDSGSWQLMLGGAVTALLLLCAAIVCCCFRCRKRIRQKRELALASANALLPEAGAQGDAAGLEVDANASEQPSWGPEVGAV